MTRDYKKPERRRDGRGGGSSFLIGMLLGLVLGLGIALGVAWYVNRMPSPFLLRSTPSEKGEAPGADTAKAGAKEKTAKAGDGKPRFDFYKILPGQEEPATDKEFREASKARSKEREAFYLQAGAFQNAPDADTLKARLALLGIEATIQTTTLPDKGVWHRVRAGPFTRIEDLNQARETLKQNGVETTLIRVRDAGAKK
jgi:cell division protein FtsN